MPFFIRARQQDIPTPTISTVASDDEDNFITDPEKFFDQLPQPFRFINKTVNKIVESAWEKISLQEYERELEAKKVKPPTYTPSSQLEKYENVTCVCLADAKIMFLSLGKSLVALNPDTNEELASWHPEEEISVERISSVFISQNELYFLSVVDDMGFGQLLIYETDTFHHVCTLNELVEGMPKSNAVHMEVSADGQYCGVTLETNKFSTIEFYRLPLENWLKEIDAARKEYVKKAESLMTTSASDISEADVPQSSSSDMDFPSIKFSPITPVLKVNEPPLITGISGKNPQQLLEAVNSGEVVGDGTCHIFSESALNIQEKIFYTLNERDLIHAEEDITVASYRPTFYFLKKSILEPPIQGKTDGANLYAGIWWSNHHNYYIYQLNKSVKNIEFKADGVWPQCADISCCSVACETMLLAIGLTNGSLTLWDRSLGIIKSVLMVSPSTPIVSIDFLIPNNSTHQKFSFYGKDIRLLVGSADGQICRVCCGKYSSSDVIAPSNNDGFNFIKPIQKLPQAFLVALKNGDMVIRSSEEDKILCFLKLPEGVQYDDPHDDGCVIDPDGDIMYLRGDSMSSPSETKIFQFHFRSFPTFDTFRSSSDDVPTYEGVTFSNMVQNILTQRMKKQASRTEELATRWHNLGKQLDIVLNLKEAAAVTRRETNFSRSSTPASNWSRISSKIIGHNKGLQKA